MLMGMSSNVNGREKANTFPTADRASPSPDYGSESSSTSPLHMTNLENSSRIVNGSGGNAGVSINGNSVGTLTSSARVSGGGGHYSLHQTDMIKQSLVNTTTDINNQNNSSIPRINNIYNMDHDISGGQMNNDGGVHYNNSSRRVPDVHHLESSYNSNTAEYKVNGNEITCHELKKWSDVSSVDKIAPFNT